MFTIAKIDTLHSKVKSGADFPDYIHQLKQLGVTSFETWVKDSHTEYFGAIDFHIQSAPKYELLTIANSSNKEQFTHDLKIHQKGETDYITFCHDCATSGIERWFVNLEKMTCTYYDKANTEVLVELVPGIV